jgi:hypothetical protein
MVGVRGRSQHHQKVLGEEQTARDAKREIGRPGRPAIPGIQWSLYQGIDCIYLRTFYCSVIHAMWPTNIKLTAKLFQNLASSV